MGHAAAETDSAGAPPHSLLNCVTMCDDAAVDPGPWPSACPRPPPPPPLMMPAPAWCDRALSTTRRFWMSSDVASCGTVRAAVFVFRREVQDLKPHVAAAILLDLPGILFFTTYTLLVLFWAEIFHQARSLPTESLRPTFLITNAAIYVIQAGIWMYMWMRPEHYGLVDVFSKFFFAGLSLIAAAGFLLYGGRLFLMLRRFPIESKGRRKKLHEVGCVTAVCFTCFTIRAVMMAISALNESADLDVLDHPVLNAVYYTLVELVPSALVLYILRKLPPKRMTGQYHAIR
eukprot:SM000080S22969  [mRNA]  locus=s80:458866:461432:+ [translate_table: standard]